MFFTVTQVAPECRIAGRFSVKGRAGLNRITFAGRVRGRRLAPGTYRITARTSAGRTIPHVTIVVFDHRPTRGQIAAARASNVCASSGAVAASITTSAEAANASALAKAEHVQREFEPTPSASGPSTGPKPRSGVLGSTVARTAEAVRPYLIALLAVAILLLGMASLPAVAVPDRRLNDLLARHRLDLTVLGGVALVAVAIAFLLD